MVANGWLLKIKSEGLAGRHGTDTNERSDGRSDTLRDGCDQEPDFGGSAFASLDI